jgi:hypothetical protein
LVIESLTSLDVASVHYSIRTARRTGPVAETDGDAIHVSGAPFMRGEENAKGPRLGAFDRRYGSVAGR